MGKGRHLTPENQWNRLARDLIYDSKQLLLYCGIKVPEQAIGSTFVASFLKKITKGTDYGAIFDPTANTIHFEPDYIQDILDTATRFDFPVYDYSFGPGGIAGFIHRGNGQEYALVAPTLDDILKQAMLAKNEEMPFGFVNARQLATFEIEQFGVMTQIFDGPIFFTVTSESGVEEAVRFKEKGHYVITNHTILQSPLTLASEKQLRVFVSCVEKTVPVMATTQPFSGQTAPMTPYGLALVAFAEFIAAMAMAYAINPNTKVVNGAIPTISTPGSRPRFMMGTVVHNFTNFLVAYTARLLDIASVQTGCTVSGDIHEKSILDTDYETVRGMILWESLFEGWHMIRHCYGFLADLASFSYEKAEADIAALHHVQSLDDSGIAAVLANNVRLYHDYRRAKQMYRQPTLLFQRERGELLNVIIETTEIYQGDFGKHGHTLHHVSGSWF
jgi:hypothetical protein